MFAWLQKLLAPLPERFDNPRPCPDCIGGERTVYDEDWVPFTFTCGSCGGTGIAQSTGGGDLRGCGIGPGAEGMGGGFDYLAKQ